jgi:hypothetical protein
MPSPDGGVDSWDVSAWSASTTRSSRVSCASHTAMMIVSHAEGRDNDIDKRSKERPMRARLRPWIRGSALVITLTVPATAGTPSDAELLAQMQQEVQRLQQPVHTTTAPCQAGPRQACEQGAQRQKQLARLQELMEGCQQDHRESCTQRRSLRRR